MNGGVRAQVASGDIGEGFVALLRAAARTVSKGQPPPSGGGSWTDEELDDLVFDMVGRVTLSRLALAANHASNDAEFNGYIKSTLRTQLHLRGRGTPRGWVIGRIDEALADDPTFERTADGWAIAGHDSADGRSEDLGELTKAAWSVETRTIRQDPDADKRQLAWREDTRAVCAAVLAVAGSLPKVTLGEVVAQRFNASYVGSTTYLDLDTMTDEADHRLPTAAVTRDERPADVDNEDAARWMLTQFSKEELVELRAVIKGGGTLRGIGKAGGHGKHKAEVLRDRVAAKLRRLGEEIGDEDRQASALLLRMVGQVDELLDSREDDGTTHG